MKCIPNLNILQENLLTGKAYGSEIGVLHSDAFHILLLGRVTTPESETSEVKAVLH